MPKILLFDIETSPILLYAWALGDEVWDPKFIRRNWFVLCWSAKWLGKKKIHHSSLPKFRGYKPLPSETEKSIDKEVMRGLWKLLDECDIAIAHNLKSFDRKKANTRFLIHGFPPPSHYELIDTLSVARSEFKFTSNKLAYLSDKLCVTKKMDPGGFDLWLGCEQGNKKAWDKMLRYCDRDVLSLEDVYLKEQPYIKKHPYQTINKATRECENPDCKDPKKGFVKDGLSRRKDGIFQKLRCVSCGHPTKTEKNG